LQKYLNSVLMNPILVSSLPARSFVDPANYCQPFGELALQHVSLALRGEVGWEVVGPLEEMGWRLRKHYYQIRCKSLPKDELMGGWTDYGPDKYLDDKDMHALFKSLNQIQHPFIHSIELCLCTDIGGLVVRSNHKDGSLRDLICGAKPRQSFLKKYGNPKGHKPLEVSQVALYGRQILEALKFLMDKGLPYGISPRFRST
jgi:PX domain-containing protein kinase-like protein